MIAVTPVIYQGIKHSFVSSLLVSHYLLRTEVMLYHKIFTFI